MRPILILAIAIALLTTSLQAADCASGNCRVERSRKVERSRGETKHERTIIRRGLLRR